MAQDVEPFDYQKTNNMDEHKQIVNKVNEIVDVINDANLDGIPQLQSDVSTLKTDVANLEADVGQNTTDIAGLDGDVDSLTANVSNIKDDITSLKAKDSELANDIATNENAITTLNGKVIKSVSATVPAEGKLRTTITLEDNSTFATDDTILGLIATGGVQIISTATARAFKLRFTLTNGTFWDTNDFVIPEGGGTDVTVTSVSIVAGSTPNSFKISIGLSDGEPIESNDYSFPTVPVASTATAGIVKVGSGLTVTDDGTLSAVPSGVPVATADTAGIVKIGANINVTADGTISVTFPDAPDLSPYLTKAEANTTYVTQIIANSTYETKANATATYATKTEVTNGLANKADTSTLSAYAKLNDNSQSIIANNLSVDEGIVSSGPITLGTHTLKSIDAGITIDDVLINIGSSKSYHYFTNLTEHSNELQKIVGKKDFILFTNASDSDGQNFNFIVFSKGGYTANEKRTEKMVVGSGIWKNDTNNYVYGVIYEANIDSELGHCSARFRSPSSNSIINGTELIRANYTISGFIYY